MNKVSERMQNFYEEHEVGAALAFLAFAYVFGIMLFYGTPKTSPNSHPNPINSEKKIFSVNPEIASANRPNQDIIENLDGLSHLNPNIDYLGINHNQLELPTDLVMKLQVLVIKNRDVKFIRDTTNAYLNVLATLSTTKDMETAVSLYNLLGSYQLLLKNEALKLVTES